MVICPNLHHLHSNFRKASENKKVPLEGDLGGLIFYIGV